MFTLRESRRGGHELRTSVYPSPSAPIATKLRQRAFQTICKFRFFDAEKKNWKFFVFFFGFSLFSADFRGARLFLTSKSNSSRFFALDGQIFRSVRPLGLIFKLFTVRTSTCGGKARATEIPEGGSAPPDPLIVRALWIVREVESHALSKCQPPTTLGDPPKVEKTIRKKF